MLRNKTILSLLLISLVSGCSIQDNTGTDSNNIPTSQVIGKVALKDLKTDSFWPMAINSPKPKLVFKEFDIAKPNTDNEYTTTKNVVFSTSGSVIFNTLSETNPKRDSRYGRVIGAVENHNKETPQNWDDLVASVKEEQDPVAKLKLANSIINKVPYTDGTDGTYYHPAKLFKKGGVCKDMAISKYLLLKDAGFPINDMRIVALTPRIDSPDAPLHIVLVAKVENSDYVLDLLPSYLAEQERKELKVSKKAQIKKIHEAGIDLNDVNITDNGFYDLNGYKSERGLIWAGNETGSRESFEPVKARHNKKKS